MFVSSAVCVKAVAFGSVSSQQFLSKSSAEQPALRWCDRRAFALPRPRDAMLLYVCFSAFGSPSSIMGFWMLRCYKTSCGLTTPYVVCKASSAPIGSFLLGFLPFSHWHTHSSRCPDLYCIDGAARDEDVSWHARSHVCVRTCAYRHTRMPMLPRLLSIYFRAAMPMLSNSS